jgi:DNA adenine methylase
MRRCNFVRMHVQKFLGYVGNGVYCDAPFPGAGDGYKFTFDEQDQRQLARKLATFRRCACVVRFYDHPLIRELYHEPLWTWNRFEGRKQTNEVAGEEVLLTRNLEK